MSKKEWKMCQIFVVFPEYLNFTYILMYCILFSTFDAQTLQRETLLSTTYTASAYCWHQFKFKSTIFFPRFQQKYEDLLNASNCKLLEIKPCRFGSRTGGIKVLTAQISIIASSCCLSQPQLWGQRSLERNFFAGAKWLELKKDKC